VVLKVQSIDHEFIATRNSSLVVMHGSGSESSVIIQRENISSKKEINKAVIMLKLPDVCS
jgi:hypothetical protein